MLAVIFVMNPSIPPPVQVDVLVENSGEVDGGGALGAAVMPTGGRE